MVQNIAVNVTYVRKAVLTTPTMKLTVFCEVVPCMEIPLYKIHRVGSQIKMALQLHILHYSAMALQLYILHRSAMLHCTSNCIYFRQHNLE
jgi:hypothetical protein